MKIKYYNQKRQSGKTTDLINMFLAKPEKTLFITVNQNMVNEIKHKIPQQYHKHIKSADSDILICGYSYDKVLIDEYDFMKYKIDVFNSIFPLLTTNGEVIIKTTPSKQYKKENYIIAKLLRNYTYESQIKYLSLLDEMNRNEVHELLESPITSSSTELFDESIKRHDNSWYTPAERTGEMFI